MSAVHASRRRVEEDEVFWANYDGEDIDTNVLDTAYENSINFLNVWKSCDTMAEFLNRDQYISVRGTTVSGIEADESLKTETDIDGVCIEWLDTSKGMDSDFTHLYLSSRPNYIRKIYPLLKKHLDLSVFEERSLKTLRQSVGCQIIYYGGWETWLGFIPEKNQKLLFDLNDQKGLATAAIERIKERFEEELRKLHARRIAIKTLAKNNLNDASKVFVLPGDQSSILTAFNCALESVELASKFKVVLFTFRFGEKSVQPVVLPIADRTAVKDITVHVGCNITSNDFDLFWCRQGLLDIVGTRGTVTTAFSFIECANFQSNLDGRKMDVSAVVRSISRIAGMRFVQLYSDLPHRYPNSRMHPVSGSVLMLRGLANELTQQSLYRDAQTYMSEIANNFHQLQDGVCRLEFVSSLLGTSFPERVTGGNLIQTDEVLALLAKHALIVPYMKELKLMEKLKAVGSYLYSRLVTAYRSGRGTGDFDMTWESYQTELAIEKLLWGHPLCSTSRIYSINLGPGIEYPSRSETDRMGFLCLNPVFTCCESENTLPPLQIFSKNATLQRQIMNVSGVVNLVEGSSGVLGRRLIMCLVKDFYVTGHVFSRENDFLLSLKADAGTQGKRLVGRITITELVRRLNTRAKTRYPMVFGSLLQMLSDRVTDMETVLQNGVINLNLGYFPAFREYDQSRNATLNWSFTYGFWVITDVATSNTSSAAAAEAEAAEMHHLVLTEMEKRRLCHSSMYRDVVFPWLEQVLRKVAERKLKIDQKVTVLTFVSCIGLYQMGRYINFSALSTLELDLHIGQRMLRDLEVLSRFLVSGVHTVRVYRLHESIPWRLDLKRKDTSNSKPAVESRSIEDFQEENQPAVERILDEERQLAEIETVEHRPMQHYPSSSGYTRWSPREIAIVMEVVSNSPSQLPFKMYQAYQRKCREDNIPDRAWAAFKRKVLRLRSTISADKDNGH